MGTALTVITILIILFFVVIIGFAFYRDYNKKHLSNYTANIIFDKYNKKIDKIISLFNNERLTEKLNEARMNIIKDEKPNESLIFENIKMTDNLEDNFSLLSNIQKEFKHRGVVQDRITLLKKPIVIHDLSEYKCKVKHPKHKAIMAFEDKLKEVKLDEKFTQILSASPCYQFGNIYMFLPNNLLKIDLDNIFACEIIDYDKIGIRVWEKDEEWIDFDGTYDLNETEHKFPEGADENNPEIKELVLQKNYVLSFTINEMTYDLIKGFVLTKEQAEMHKLTMRKF